MRILYISQHFPPEISAPAIGVHELAREWVRSGNEVSVLTGFPNHPHGRKLPSDQWILARKDRLDGMDVFRSYVWATPNKGVAKRMLSHAVFMASAVLSGSIRVPRVDAVIGVCPTLLCALSGYIVARRLGAPFVFEVRDLWPESVLAVEAMTDNFIVRSLKQVARFLYQRADQIVTVGNGYRQEIHERYGIPLEHMEVVHNGVDPNRFLTNHSDHGIRSEFGWGDRFVVLYLGTVGMAHALHVALEAADQLRAHPEVLFVIVGEGAEKANLVRFARQKKLPNVQFIDEQPKERVPGFYSACDVGLVPLRNTKLFQSVLPSKIFELFACEKPVLVSVDGEARRLVEAADAGWFVSPDDKDALCSAVMAAYEKRAQLGKMGRSGRNYVMTHHDRGKLARKYLEIIARVSQETTNGECNSSHRSKRIHRT